MATIEEARLADGLEVSFARFRDEGDGVLKWRIVATAWTVDQGGREVRRKSLEIDPAALTAAERTAVRDALKACADRLRAALSVADAA
jgi:hypothetical protein